MKKNTLFTLLTGILIGILVTGPVGQAASEVKARLREVTVYVDGQPVTMEAVNVNDTNYVKLRDVGEAVGFNVWWDGEVRVDTSVPYTSKAPEKEQSSGTGIDLAANMEVRREIIRRVNELRAENGLDELPVDESLMNAAQDISTKGFKDHCTYEWEAMAAYGWVYGGAVNLTYFTCNNNTDIAKQAVTNWRYSPGHLKAMLRADVTCIGAGVTFANDRAFCYLIVGSPTGHSPLG